MYHSVWIVWLLLGSMPPTHGHALARLPVPNHRNEAPPPKTCITNSHPSASAPHPAITDPPQPVLQKRASSTVSSNTCGWVNGTYGQSPPHPFPPLPDSPLPPGSGIYCGIDRTCMFYTPALTDTASSLPGMAGCCRSSNRADCAWRRTCYASSELSASCTASACLSDPFVLRCTNSTAPACASWTYQGVGARDYACTLAESTGNWTTVLQTGVDDFFTPATTYTVDVVFAAASEVLSMTTTTASGSGVVETGAAETGTSGQGGGGGGVSVGAIVGGVVGGVVGLALVVAAVVVLCCVSKKKQRRAGERLGASGMVHEADGSLAMDANAAELHDRSCRHPVELENIERQRPVEMPFEGRYELH